MLRLNLTDFTAKTFHTINPAKEFLPNWHIDVIAEHLEACTRGEITRLIINLPPRSLKSICVSVAWPAWLLGHDPARRVIVASYAQGVSVKHSLDCRAVMQTEWYKGIFPAARFASDQNEKHKFATTEKGFRLATSVGGSVTGEGGDFLIVDDPHNATDIFSDAARQNTLDWFDQVFLSRADDKKKGVFVVVMQRLHEEDLTGYLLAKKAGWEHLCIPAISKQKTTARKIGEAMHPEREDVVRLEAMKKELGSYVFAAQYQQNPLPKEGGIIKREWLRRYKVMPESFEQVVQSWDTAMKTSDASDYSVCTTWGEAGHGYYLLDVQRARLEYPDLKRAVVGQAEKWSPHAILMEDKASGQSLLQDLKQETKLPLIAVTPVKDKLTRIVAVSSLFEAGKVYLPESGEWLADYEAELLRFPSAKHDDQVDATSQFLGWVRRRVHVVPGVRRI